MTKTLTILRQLTPFKPKQPDGPSQFDQRLQKLGGVRQVRVARAVLFKTAASHPAA